MGVELELWTRDAGDLAELLPRAAEWDVSDGTFEFDGDGWLVSIFAPEPAPDDVPADLAALVDGLRYRIEIGIEPSSPDPEAWDLLRDVLESLGLALHGASVDPESGRSISWTGNR